jgi:hypothetical protein
MITLDYHGTPTDSFDTSYQISSTYLWAIAECTCIFLVFSVPVLPKLFAEHSIWSRFATSIRTWASSSQADRPAENIWPSTHRQIQFHKREKDRKCLFSEDGLLMTHQSHIELAPLHEVHVQERTGGFPRASHHGIVKTVDFTTSMSRPANL